MKGIACRRRIALHSSILAMSVILLSAPASAATQDEAATGQNEDRPGAVDNEATDIVITATRRNTLLSDTPISISVVSGDTLQRDNISTITDLNGRIPGLAIGSAFGGSRIAIRGVGFNPTRPGDEGRVAYYVDQVYIARTSAQLGALFDVDRIEVLRGPQGTLYGRNATGGAVLVSTRDPTSQPSGYLNATIGNYDLRQFSGALSGPLSDELSARVAFETVDRDGYNFNRGTGNRVNGANTSAVRGTLLWRPSSQFRLRLSADSFRADDSNAQLMPIRPSFVVPVVPILFGSRDIDVPRDSINQVNSYGGSLVATYTPSDYLTVTAVGGFRHVDLALRLDGAGCIEDCSVTVSREDSDHHNFEFQLAGDGARFDWIAGFTYFSEDQSPSYRSAIVGAFFGNPAAPYLAQGTRSSADLGTEAKSLFAEGTFDITDQLSLTAGIRYSWETKDMENEISAINLTVPWPDPSSTDFGFVPTTPRPGFPRNDSVSFDAWTPRFALSYEVSPAASIYVSYTRGFKSGGFNYGTIQDAYTPETIISYEAGFNAALLQRRISLRGALFRYDYQRLQQTVNTSNPPGTFVLNTGDATIQGVELEFVANITQHFRIDGNASILDSEFAPYEVLDPNRPELGVIDIGGNRVPQAPKYTLFLGAQHSWDVPIGEISLRGTYRRQGRTYYDIFGTSVMSQGAYDVIDANLAWRSRDDHWRASLFVRNIGNTYAVNQLALIGNAIGGAVMGALIPPRTYGLSVGYEF